MTRLTILAAGCALLAAVAAFAGDDGGQRNVVIVGDDGEKATLTLDGTRLTVTAEDGDDISVREVDLAEIAAMVDEALEGAMVDVEKALAALAESDIEVRVDPEHRLVVQADGETATIDLDEVMAAVADAMDGLDVTLDAEGGDADETRLRQEIEALRAEIDGLRSELERR